MPQIARTDDKKPAEEIKTGADRAKDIARDFVDKGRSLADDAVETTAAAMERTAAKSTAVAERAIRDFPSLATSATENGTGAGFWLDLVKAQTAQNIDAFRQMMTARTPQELMSIQSSYLSANLARMTEAASRCMQLTGAMVRRPVTNGSREASTAR